VKSADVLEKKELDQNEERPGVWNAMKMQDLGVN
jgi:hypothetical protein